MENFKYMVGTYAIYPATEVRIVVPKQYEEELTIMAANIGDLISLDDALKRKEELLKLLKELNELSNKIVEAQKADLKQEKESENKAIPSSAKMLLALRDSMDYNYLYGKTSGLRQVLLSAIKNISYQAEYNKKLSEEQANQIIEEAKDKENISYLG